jgi:plasmid stabilization system protein ParE
MTKMPSLKRKRSERASIKAKRSKRTKTSKHPSTQAKRDKEIKTTQIAELELASIIGEAVKKAKRQLQKENAKLREENAEPLGENAELGKEHAELREEHAEMRGDNAELLQTINMLEDQNADPRRADDPSQKRKMDSGKKLERWRAKLQLWRIETAT